MPADPIVQLHSRLKEAGLLSQANLNYDNFVISLSEEGARYRLHGFLTSKGETKSDFNTFNTFFFSGYDNALAGAQARLSKKKDGTTGFTGTSSDAAPAQSADTGTKPSAADDYSDLLEGFEISDEALVQKIRDGRLASNPNVLTSQPLVSAESTGVATPLAIVRPDWDINPDAGVRADQSPLSAGTEVMRGRDSDFDFKERRAARSDLRTIDRNFQKVKAYNEEADKQSRTADFRMRMKYGEDWLDQLDQLRRDLDPEYLSRNREDIDGDEIVEKQALLNNMTSDPNFNLFMHGVQAQQNAYKAYKEIAKSPAYVQHLAEQERSREAADQSALYKGMSFLGQVSGPVIAGIAALPRTITSAAGLGDVPIVDDLADWADEQTDFIQAHTSLGSKADRRLWTRMTEYKGMQVEVDNAGRPAQAYRNGLPVDMSDTEVEDFIASGVANNARNSFTGWENAGFAIAKTLANLYLMRSLGGGTQIGTGTVAFTTTYNDLYLEALNDLGYSAAEAAQYAIANATIQAAAEATFGKIDVAPLTLQTARTFGVRQAKALLGQQSAADLGKAAGKAIVREVLGENAEELAQMATDHLSTAFFNATAGGNIEREVTGQDVAETILLTTAATLIGAGADSGTMGVRSDANMALIAAAENPTAIAPVLQEMVAQGYLTADQVPVITARLQNIALVNATLPSSMSQEDRAQVLALELHKSALQGAVSKESTPEQKSQINKAVQETDAQIEEIKNPEPEVEASAAAATEVPMPDSPIETTQAPSPVTDIAEDVAMEEDIAEDVIMEDQQELPADVPVANIEPAIEPAVAEQSSATEETPPAVRTDLREMLSPEYQPFVTEGDLENLNEWVQANLSDPDEVAQNGGEQQTIEAAVSEYQQTILKPKYARQVRDYKKRGTARPVTQPSPDIPIQAHALVSALPESEQSAVAQTLGRYISESGDMDMDALIRDLNEGTVTLPESIKQIVLNETEPAAEAIEPVGNIESERGQGRAVAPDGRTAPVPQTTERPVAQRGQPANVTAPSTETPAAPETAIDADLQTAPLPALDNDVLMEMLDDGLIDVDTLNQASRYLYADDRSQEALNGYEQALAAREGLRRVKERQITHQDRNLTVQKREDGVTEIYGNVGDANALLNAGAVYNPVLGRYEVSPENEVAVLEALSAQMVDEDVPPSEPLEDTNQALEAPAYKQQARKRNAKYKAAKSFDERLDVAQAEHGTRRSAADRTAVQRVLGKLKKSLPGVKAHTTAREYNDKLREVAEAKGLNIEVRNGIPGVLTEDGQWIAPSAMTVDGEVYINPDLAHVDAPIHEFGHIWNAWLRQNNEPEYNRGAALAKDSPYLEAVKANPLYSDLDEEAQIDEALSQAIGDSGRNMVDMTPFVRFRNWLSDLWRDIEGAVGVQRAQQMTLQQWADRQARTLIAGQPATRQSGRDIAAQEARNETAKRAEAMERLGASAPQIHAATGARRQADGSWLIRPLQATARFDENSTLPEQTTFNALVLAPAVTSAYPDFDMPVTLDAENRHPYVRDGRLVMAPISDGQYLQRVLSVVQQQLPIPAGVPTAVKFMSTPPNTGQPVPASTDQASRLQSARQIIRAELATEGMKNYREKTKRLADALGLRHEDVLLAWETEADQAKYGRLVFSLGDAKAMGKGKWGKLVEALDIRHKVALEKTAEFLQRYFTVKGLMPAEIKVLAEQRAGAIAGRMVEAKYILKDLEAAMKQDYGKVDEVHWQLVDNVLRGQGNWDMLPENVRVAAKTMRDFTDSLSRELITSGATNGKVVLTILNNAGVAATAKNMLNYNGVNLFHALDKLPYMRTGPEHYAIELFLKENQHNVGSYFYRSYRKHKDKNWDKKVPPRVLADARAFLISHYEGRIQEIEQARTENGDKIQNDIDKIEQEILVIKTDLQDKLTTEQARIKDLEHAQATYTHTHGTPSPSLKRQQDAAMESANKWAEALSDVKAVTALDIEIVMELTEVDLSAVASYGQRIINKRRKRQRLQERLDRVGEYRKGEADRLRRLLDTRPGDMGGIDGIIANILHTDDIGGPLPVASLGSKDLSFLKKRKDIPQPIRDLMGEYHDARVNFVESTMRMINTIEDQLFLTQLRDQYEGVFFFPPEAEDMGIPLSSRGSAAKDPLNGWRTSPQIKKALDDYYRDRYDFPAVIAGLRYLSDLVKYGKTILSPVTHFRNFMSNFYFIAQNGYLPGDAAKSWDAFKNAWDLRTDEEHRAYIEKLATLGVIGGGAASGDIKAVMQRVNKDAISNMYGGNLWERALQTIQKTYTAEDDFFRIMAFEAEKKRYSKAYYGHSFDNLTVEQQADIERLAADLVSETMPTYSKVPEAITFLREVPLFGTFVAFPAEMFRITYNQAKRTVKEMSDPRTRGIGVRRMIGMTIAQSLPMAAVAIARHFVGVDEEEEKAMRYFTPPWQQDSMWVWDSFERGKQASFRNLGYSDPYAFYKRPIIRLMSGPGQSVRENMADGAWSLVAPFLGVELTTGTILSLAYNRNPQTGQEIYNPGAGILRDWRSFGQFAVRALQPGAVKFGYDVASVFTGEGQFGKPPKDWDDIVLNMAGYATEKNDIEQSATFRAKAAKREIEYARQWFYQNRYKYRNDPAGMRDMYERATGLYNDGLKEVSLLIENGQKVGIPSSTLLTILDGQRLSKKEIQAAVTGTRLYPRFEGFNK